MAWTTPKTDWTTGELVSASDMNSIGQKSGSAEKSSESGRRNDGRDFCKFWFIC